MHKRKTERGLADPSDGFDNRKFRLGINDYEHLESEAGEVGTAFANKAREARATGSSWRYVTDCATPAAAASASSPPRWCSDSS